MKIVSVVGARPNFMKIAPFIKAIKEYNEQFSIPDNKSNTGHASRGMRYAESGTRDPEKIDHILVHTGQHYDDSMSKAFFDELNIPEPDINLGIGSGTHAEQVGNTMIAFEKVLKAEKPDWVVVVGDVNATLACSVTAKKECIKCCHIEAGLRSGDMTMPEEINRLVTDHLSDLLLAPDILSIRNLKSEGVPESKIRFVGNIMIDTLEANRLKAEALDINDIIDRNLVNRVYGRPQAVQGKLNENREPITPALENFAVLTIHRPSNVDIKEVFEPIVNFLTNEVAKELTLIWPVHPRTRNRLLEFGLYNKVADNQNIILLEPLGYLDMLRLNMEARVILTDSGGLQEECTVLGTPCLTMRDNTERPVTLQENGGASMLVGNNIERIRQELPKVLNKPRTPYRPPLWDGKTAERCLKAILEA
jgi:UDP-N-acetylglucosamine 2-epimerase (non-hydrolysing)